MVDNLIYPHFNVNQLIESSHSLKCVLLTFSMKHHISVSKLTQSTCKLLRPTCTWSFLGTSRIRSVQTTNEGSSAGLQIHS